LFSLLDIRSLVTTLLASAIIFIVTLVAKYFYNWYIEKHPLKVKCYYIDEDSKIMLLKVESRKRIHSCEAEIIFTSKDSEDQISLRGVWSSIYRENRYEVSFEDKGLTNYLVIPLTIIFDELRGALARIGAEEKAFSKQKDIIEDYGLTPAALLDEFTHNIIEAYSKVFRRLNNRKALISIQFNLRTTRLTIGPPSSYVKEVAVAEVEVRNERISIVRVLSRPCIAS